MEVRTLFGRFVWCGVIDEVTIHPSWGSRINPTLKDCKHNRVSYASVPQHRRDRNLSRKCTTNLIPRQNHNGEVMGRSWLCFSPSQTCVKCFTCRLMCADMTKCTHFHIRKGIFDWNHALELLRSHEHSMEHIICRCHDHPYLNIFCIHTWGPSPRLGPRSPTIWLQCCLTLKCTIDQFSHS